ncbi:MAG: FAD-binding oxidoreductase [Holophagales bacterium]|nr:FAD-binding oxidoreductase [Holophagales bacterium]
MTRELSFWGWGYADRFPGRTKSLALAARLRMGLGFEAGFPRRPPRLAELELSSPRVQAPPELEAFVSEEKEDRAHHTYGRAYRDIVRGFYGDFSAAPDLVAHPRTEEEVERVLEWADGRGVAVVPFGGGTSVVGGVETRGEGFRGVLSLDSRGLDQVLEVDPVSRAARIQAGATGPLLEAQLAADGLTLRHFPQSFEFSTLGGWIATRAGGHFATVYTHIDDLVESVRMISPAGIWESRRLPASGAGPSPDRLILGSEGTLGVITEAWMRVRPRPRHRSRASVLFDDFERAVGAVRAVAQSGLFPTNCRLLDGREARLNQVVSDGSSVRLLGFEAADLSVKDRLAQALRIALDAGGRCPDGPHHRGPDDGEPPRDAAGSWRQAFFDGPYLQSTLVSLGILADTFETACTWQQFPALHRAIQRDVGAALERVCGKGFLSCRFTHVYPDGPAPYYTFLAPTRRGAELEHWAEIKRVASETLLEHCASITHHHAVGRMHRPWYQRQAPAPFLDVLRAAKAELDPGGILNPGVLLEPVPVAG